jgi:Cu(I)/Ag(I) efflux system membrane protein CusA/SilA
MIRSEDAVPAASVFVDVRGRDLGSYVEEARRMVASQVELPEGYFLRWSGQYESLARVRERLELVVPLTLLIVFLLLYLNFRSVTESLIVMLTLPFALVGGIWFLWILGYNLSVAVWVGLIALAGLDAETGVIMLLYLTLSHRDAERRGRLRTFGDLEHAIVDGAARRIRPKLMTVLTTMIGLAPILWSTGAGSDVMRRIAAPMVGGLVTSFLLELTVYPAIFALWKERALAGRGDREEPA